MNDSTGKVQIYVNLANDEGDVFLTDKKPLLKLNIKNIPGLKEAIDNGFKSTKDLLFIHTFSDVIIFYANINKSTTEYMVTMHYKCNLEKAIKEIKPLGTFKQYFKQAIDIVKREYKGGDYQFVRFNFVLPEDVINFEVN